MTSSVPYSFVPGAKAKAEEVNANFIAVLGEIEKSNVKIEELDSQKLDKDLSNIDEQGQKILDAKADKTEIDGNWTSKSSYIASGVTTNASYNKSFDLSSFLPEDENVYEVIISVIIRSSTKLNDLVGLYVSSSCSGTIALCRIATRVSGSAQVASGNCVIPIGKDRKINFFVGEESVGSSYSGGCTFRMTSYRKAR